MSPPQAAESLPEGALATDRVDADGVLVHSLTAHALAAIDRHKWIESERVGRDLGDAAVGDWIDRYWKGWVRARLIEHLYGWRCWGAFDRHQFGLLHRSTVEHHLAPDTLRVVAGILGEGGENLDVLTWAMHAGEPLEPLLWLLDRIDVNAHRRRLLADHIRLFALPEPPP